MGRMEEIAGVLDTARKGLGDDVVLSASVRIPVRPSDYPVIHRIEQDLHDRHSELVGQLIERVMRVVNRGRGTLPEEVYLVKTEIRTLNPEETLHKAFLDELLIDELDYPHRLEDAYKALGYKYIKKEIDPKTGKWRYWYKLPQGRVVHAEDPLHPEHVAAPEEIDPIRRIVPFGRVEDHPRLLAGEMQELSGSILQPRAGVKRRGQSEHFKNFVRPLIDQYLKKHFKATYEGEALTEGQLDQFNDYIMRLSRTLNELGHSLEDLANEDVIRQAATDRKGNLDQEVYDGIKEYVSDFLGRALNDPGLHREYLLEKRAYAANVMESVEGQKRQVSELANTMLDGDPHESALKLIGVIRSMGLIEYLEDGRLAYNEEVGKVLDEFYDNLSPDQRVAVSLAKVILDENHDIEESWKDFGEFRGAIAGLEFLDYDAKAKAQFNNVGYEAGKIIDDFIAGHNTEMLRHVLLPEDLGGYPVKDLIANDRLIENLRNDVVADELFRTKALEAKTNTEFARSQRLPEGEFRLAPFQAQIINHMLAAGSTYIAAGAGGGKSRVLIEYTAVKKDAGDIDGLLYLTKPGLLDNMKKEILKWHPDANIEIITGSKAERIAKIKSARGRGVEFILASAWSMKPRRTKKEEDQFYGDEPILTNSEITDLLNDPELQEIQKMSRYAVAVDEGHELGFRNRKSLSYQIAEKVFPNVPNKFITSATPIGNHPGEFYNQIDLLHPGALAPDEKAFNARYSHTLFEEDPVTKQQTEIRIWNNFSKLHEKMAPYAYIIHAHDPEFQEYLNLPEPEKNETPIDWHPAHFAYYSLIHEAADPFGTPDYDELQKWVENMRVSEREWEYKPELAQTEGLRRMTLMAAATRIMQDLSISPKLVDPNYQGPQPVIETARQNVFRHIQTGDDTPYIVAAQNIRALDLVREELVAQGLNPEVIGEISGRTAETRDQVRNLYDEGKVRVLLLGIEAGGSGLNLQAGWNMDILDQTWTPDKMEQLIRRVWRPGADAERKIRINYIAPAGSFQRLIGARNAEKVRLQNALLLGDRSIEEWRQISDRQIYMTTAWSNISKELSEQYQKQSPKWRASVNRFKEQLRDLVDDRTLAQVSGDNPEVRQKAMEKVDEAVRQQIAEISGQVTFGGFKTQKEYFDFLRHQERAAKQAIKQARKGPVTSKQAKKIVKDAA